MKAESSSLFNKLRVRQLVLVCLATLPALAFILYFTSYQRMEARRSVEVEAVHLTRLASREHVRQIAAARELLLTLAQNTALWTSKEAVCPKLLPTIFPGFRQSLNLGILNRDGTLLCSVVPPQKTVNMSETAVFTRAMNSHSVEAGDYQIGLIVQKPVLVLAYAMRNASDSVRQVLFVALDLMWFNELTSEVDLPEGSSFTIVDRHGVILAHPQSSNSEWIGKPLPYSARFIRLIEQRQPVAGVLEERDLDGTDRLLAFAPIKGIEGVYVMVGIPRDQAFAETNQTMLYSLLGLILVVIFAIATGWIGTEVFILRDIRGLTRTARQLEEGDLTARSSVRRGIDEIHTLSRAFNSMATALDYRHREALLAQEQLRALSQRIQKARDEESFRISRELHDQLGQNLTAHKIDLNSLKRQVGKDLASEADQATLMSRIDEMTERVESSIQFVRHIATQLRPSLLDQLGLDAAMEKYAEEFETTTGIRCHVDLHATGKDLSSQASLNVFRIFQEALTNVSRHAQATVVWVDLYEKESLLHLMISDNGKGMSPSLFSHSQSLGLMGMRERAKLLGGALTIKSSEGAGTTVLLTIPQDTL